MAVFKNLSGAIVVLMLCVYIACSAHAGRFLDGHQTWAAFDQVTTGIVHEVKSALRWLFAQRVSRSPASGGQ